MYNIAILISGFSIAISVFLLIITFGAIKRRRMKILPYMGGVFIIILISNVVYVLQTFSVFPGIGNDAAFFLSVELIILLLFYVSIVRGLG